MNPKDISAVLLGGQWYSTDGQGIILTRFMFVERDSDDTPKRTADGEGRIGFAFRALDGEIIHGPLSAIQAVKERRRQPEPTP